MRMEIISKFKCKVDKKKISRDDFFFSIVLSRIMRFLPRTRPISLCYQVNRWFTSLNLDKKTAQSNPIRAEICLESAQQISSTECVITKKIGGGKQET